MTPLEISFIIPAYNEEVSLPRVLSGIHQHVPASIPYEVIVVDNGSLDDTVELAKSMAAKVYIDETATVGGLRNLGVTKASGSALVFLDADVILTDEWATHIHATLLSLKEMPLQVTGSRCGITTNMSWIERYWFKPLIKNTANYINSGHLITSAELFNRIDGFDSSMVTGEDYAFSQAAVAAGANIINNPSLAVVHEGYPGTVYQFIRREIWHGRGDCESIATMLASKVVLASWLFVFLHLVAVVTLLIDVESVWVLLPVTMIAGICIFPALYKNQARSLIGLIAVSFLYYCYYFSRFLSCLPTAIFEKGESGKRHR